MNFEKVILKELRIAAKNPKIKLADIWAWCTSLEPDYMKPKDPNEMIAYLRELGIFVLLSKDLWKGAPNEPA